MNNDCASTGILVSHTICIGLEKGSSIYAGILLAGEDVPQYDPSCVLRMIRLKIGPQLGGKKNKSH